MKVTRIYTGEDGESHFAEIDIPIRDAGEIGALSERFPVSVLLVIPSAPRFQMPPPWPSDEFPDTVLFVMSTVPTTL